MDDFTAIRRDYARRICGNVRGIDPRIVDAFAAVPRERFLGPPPWRLIGDKPQSIASRVVDGADLAPVYDDVLVELDGARGVNNGSPSLHALMLNALAVRPGDVAVHIGAGGGYYAALLGELVEPDGKVVAVEFDTALAAAAAAHLADRPNVTLVNGDGAAFPTEPVDRIYVNFGVVAPPRRWVDLLRDGGTLVFPLTAPRLGRTTHSGGGVVLRVQRSGATLDASVVSPCGFVMAEGPLSGTEDQRARLAVALGERTLGLGRIGAGDVWGDTACWGRWFG